MTDLPCTDGSCACQLEDRVLPLVKMGGAMHVLDEICWCEPTVILVHRETGAKVLEHHKVH